MTDITTAFWGMTINNYDDTDVALVQQGYPDYIRQLVWTYEEGEQGTPHIQGYIKLFRQQRLSYVKKLFPRGNFKALTSDEYKLNAQRYAQKQDDTSKGHSVINNNPFPDPIVELTSICQHIWDNVIDDEGYSLDWEHKEELLSMIKQEEFDRVVQKPTMAKFYVSATYKNVKKEFWLAVFLHVEKIDTTHNTHTDEKFSRRGSISDADSEKNWEKDSCDDSTRISTKSEDYQDYQSETDERTTTSKCSRSSSSSY